MTSDFLRINELLPGLKSKETNTMASIDSKLNLWNNKLLDLGKRNRLVNFKDTRMSTVRIIEPSCINLYNYFVVDEKRMAVAV